MENTPEQTPKKSFLIWGIPILILVILIVLLIMELTSDDSVDVDPQTQEEVVIQPTEEQQDDATIEVQPIDQTDEEESVSSDEEGVTEAENVNEDQLDLSTAADTAQTDEQYTEEESEEAEKSYIVEEGDSLWKIAKKKNVLDDPWKWKTILIQNREKINYTIFSEETGQWKVIVDAGKRLSWKSSEKTKAKTSFDRTRKKRYAVQLLSMNLDQLERGVNIVKFLIKDGYHAYLYRTRDKIKIRNSKKSQYFYRIRVGFFETEREAISVGEDIVDEYEEKKIFSPDFWAVLPSYSELNGELIDFGIQRNKPWIIQLTEVTSRSEAINDLKTLVSMVDYSYISQKRNPEGGFLYRIRVGFYETRANANKVVAKIRGNAVERFPDAEVLEIRHVMEDALGQSTGKTSLKKIRN